MYFGPSFVYIAVSLLYGCFLANPLVIFQFKRNLKNIVLDNGGLDNLQISCLSILFLDNNVLGEGN